MKNIAKVTALALGIALASGYASAEEKIAFINAGYIFQHHPDRQAVADKLDAEFKPVAEKLAASKKKLMIKLLLLVKSRSKSCGFRKDAPRLRQADIQKRQQEINKLGAAEDAELQKLMQEQDKKFKNSKLKMKNVKLKNVVNY